MTPRDEYLRQLATAVRRSPVVALLGPRQCGKTTLASAFAAAVARNGSPSGRMPSLEPSAAPPHPSRFAAEQVAYFDLESEPDVRALANAELVLGAHRGLVVLDEIQRLPELFNALRVLVDRPDNTVRFLVLGSASPELVRGASESLAGRVEFVEVAGFDLAETDAANWRTLWRRGGTPRSYLAASEDDSMAWRDGFVRTFLERDIPQLGITVPAAAMRRFWTMLAHWHGQTWNASELGRSIAATDKTARRYLDLLTGTYMVRQLQPWFANVAKRQVKAPKVYLRDAGLLHFLLGIGDETALFSHPRVGASWEGFAIEQVLRAVRPASAWFWATHGGGEVDLLVYEEGRRWGFEMKFAEAPRVTRSMHGAVEALTLDHLFVVCPAPRGFPVSERISVLPITEVVDLPSHIGRL